MGVDVGADSGKHGVSLWLVCGICWYARFARRIRTPMLVSACTWLPSEGPALRRGCGFLRHGPGHAAQNVDFFSAELRAVEQLVQPRHEFLGRSRVQKADVGERFLPVLEHARHGGG